MTVMSTGCMLIPGRRLRSHTLRRIDTVTNTYVLTRHCFVDFNFHVSSVCLILLEQVKIWPRRPWEMEKPVELQNSSQQNLVTNHHGHPVQIEVPTVIQPMAKAQTSVSDVTVMATPAWRMALPILSARSSVVRDFSWLLKHCRMTNMSSIPIPVKFLLVGLERKFYLVCRLIYHCWFVILTTG